MSNYSVELDAVHSNIVLISTPEGTAKSVVSSLAEQGVDIIDIHDSQVRAVTPSITTSKTPPTFVEIIALFAAWPSIKVTGVPSFNDSIVTIGTFDGWFKR